VGLDRLSTNNEVAGFKFRRWTGESRVLRPRARLVKAAGIVPGVIWLVLFGGAVLTIGFTFFFGTVNLRAQALMTGALTMLIFSGLLIIVTIDHPFTGAVKVEPEALLEVIHDLGHGHAPAPAR
jgi:hypothetical protein